MDGIGLAGFVPFNGLSAEALAQAAAVVREIRLGNGQHLFHRGDADALRYYLIEGRVALDAGDGSPPLLVQAGSEAGRHCLARLKPRRYSAVALVYCRVLAFDETELDAMIAQDQSTSYEVQEFEGNDPYWMFDLLRNPAFTRVPSANLHALFMCFRPLSVSAGQEIIHQGDARGEYYYLIREGRALVSRHEAAGQSVELARLGPGDGFGEEALIAQAARSASVRMQSDGLLMCLASDDFDTLLKAPLLHRVSAAEAAALLKGGNADLIDVRLADEFLRGHLKGSVNIPLCRLRLKAASLEKQRVHILVCETGRRSSVAAFLLEQRGLDARVLAGGYDALKQARDKPVA